MPGRLGAEPPPVITGRPKLGASSPSIRSVSGARPSMTARQSVTISRDAAGRTRLGQPAAARPGPVAGGPVIAVVGEDRGGVRLAGRDGGAERVEPVQGGFGVDLARHAANSDYTLCPGFTKPADQTTMLTDSCGNFGLRPDCGGRMTGDCHVRSCERRGETPPADSTGSPVTSMTVLGGPGTG